MRKWWPENDWMSGYIMSILGTHRYLTRSRNELLRRLDAPESAGDANKLLLVWFVLERIVSLLLAELLAPLLLVLMTPQWLLCCIICCCSSSLAMCCCCWSWLNVWCSDCIWAVCMWDAYAPPARYPVLLRLTVEQCAALSVFALFSCVLNVEPS